MSFDLHLNGLRAVVTGGTLGLGAAVVKALSEAGARVATSARTLPAQPVAGVIYVAADLSTAEGTSHLAQTILKDWGGVDILINVLGGSTCSAAQKLPVAASLRSVMSTGSPS